MAAIICYFDGCVGDGYFKGIMPSALQTKAQKEDAYHNTDVDNVGKKTKS